MKKGQKKEKRSEGLNNKAKPGNNEFLTVPKSGKQLADDFGSVGMPSTGTQCRRWKCWMKSNRSQKMVWSL